MRCHALRLCVHTLTTMPARPICVVSCMLDRSWKQMVIGRVRARRLERSGPWALLSRHLISCWGRTTVAVADRAHGLGWLFGQCNSCRSSSFLWSRPPFCMECLAWGTYGTCRLVDACSLSVVFCPLVLTSRVRLTEARHSKAIRAEGYASTCRVVLPNREQARVASVVLASCPCQLPPPPSEMEQVC